MTGQCWRIKQLPRYRSRERLTRFDLLDGRRKSFFGVKRRHSSLSQVKSVRVARHVRRREVLVLGSEGLRESGHQKIERCVVSVISLLCTMGFSIIMQAKERARGDSG